jgi:hypothetical protein
MDHLVLRERHKKRKQKRLGIMPASSAPDDANLLWRHGTVATPSRIQQPFPFSFSSLFPFFSFVNSIIFI